MSITAPSADRTIVYIDGFNLYFGLRAAGWRKYYWLDMVSLATKLAGAGRLLVQTCYFTSRISGPPAGATSAWAVGLNAKRKRQTDYLDALATLPGLHIEFGHYLDKPASCHACGATWTSHEEKMTDVNIATALLTDAFQDRFDTAVVVSGDSDLVPPIRAIQALFPQKTVLVAFPPRRFSNALKNLAGQPRTIYEKALLHSQLPDPVVLPNGFPIPRPPHWH